MPFASLYGFKKRGEEEEREPETNEEKRARMDARVSVVAFAAATP